MNSVMIFLELAAPLLCAATAAIDLAVKFLAVRHGPRPAADAVKCAACSSYLCNCSHCGCCDGQTT